MTGDLGVPCHVMIRRTVAAQGCTTGLAGSQVHPGIASLHTLFAFQAFRKFQRSYFRKMIATW